MTQILLRAHDKRMWPIDTQGEQYIRKLKPDEIVRADIKRVRNPRQHRLYWGLIALVHPQQDEWPTVASLSKAILSAIGHGKVTTSKSGIQTIEAKSIAFGNMANDEFEEILTRAIGVICERILPGVKSESLRREVLEIVGDG